MDKNKEIENKLREILIGREVSQIDKSEDYIIRLNHFPIRNDDFPNVITFSLLSNWYIKEMGAWKSLNTQFPIDTTGLSIPYDPIKAFYLLYITEKSKITAVEFGEDSLLKVTFNKDFTIVLPNSNEYYEYAWIISGRNLRISYNADEKSCSYEEAY